MNQAQQNENCQTVMTSVLQELQPLFTAIQKIQQNTVPLQLSRQQLPLFAAAWQPQPRQKVLMVDLSARQAAALHATLVAWAELFDTSDHWHLINGHLTDQERHGLVQTDLSRAVHHLMGASNQACFVVPASLADTSFPDHKKYEQASLRLTIGEKGALTALSARLVSMGFTRQGRAAEPGSFAVAGERITLNHPAIDGQYELSLYGNSLESLAHIKGGRRYAVSSITVPPVAFPETNAPWKKLTPYFSLIRPSFLTALHGHFTIETDALFPAHDFPFHPKPVAKVLRSQKTRAVFYDNFDRVNQSIRRHSGGPVLWCPSSLASQTVALASPSLVLVSEQALFPRHIPDVSPISYQKGIELIAQLTVGQPAVHSDHGVGIFEGLQQRAVSGSPQEYLVLRYAAGDALSVPVTYAHKVTPYIGSTIPKVQRLGGVFWHSVKAKARQDAERFASELLNIARRRAAVTRPALRLDRALDVAVDRSSGYTLTPDQERTWQEVASDLMRPQPMNRLLVGDVGFGKTEIALRAAAQAVASGRQVALLAPTTILVEQHGRTFASRLPHLEDRIVTLSRFASPALQKKIRQRLADGTVSVAIGTHALLSIHTRWHNLGLIIIDEEQRFGVRQKEHFKKIRAEVDVLSMSATPIPRTLSIALAGLQDLSLITTPPEGRQAIETIVGPDTDRQLARAIAEEMKRGGQIYVVAPRVRKLSEIEQRLRRLVPAARIARAHGKIESRELAAVMERLAAGQIDVLLSSNIIGSGIDLPNVNTIIVLQAPQFGLSELYQLRGRVGRRSARGFAYFLYGQNELSPAQRRRLAALTEAARLGSGWELARRDLEIRGAGNLLGAEQSGTVNTVGVQLYLDLIHDAIAEQSNEPHRRDINIELPLPAIIPAHYIANLQQRTRWYLRLSRAHSMDELAEQTEELERAFGPMPPETKNLIAILRLQHAAAAAGITAITADTITPPQQPAFQRVALKSHHLPRLLSRLATLGHGTVRNETFIIDVPSITPQFIATLTRSLQTAA